MATSNRGIVKLGQGKAVLTSVPVPKLRDDCLLLRTIAVALNPTDWQTVDEAFSPGTTRSLIGCDCAGIVVEVGSKLTGSFKKGDRVAAFAHGGNDHDEEDGTFAEYIIVKGALRVPDHLSFEKAATLSSALITIALGLYRHIGLPFLTLPLSKPAQGGPPLLIYGGSSAMGTMAIQFAKLSGQTVITTASPHNFELLESLGADHIFDYHDPDCGQKINALTQNKLEKVFDTIAVPSSAKISAEALSSHPGGLYVGLLPIECPRDDVKSVFFLGYTASGEAFEIEGQVWPADLHDYELAKKFFALSEKLLDQGVIKNHPESVRGGIEDILDGMQLMREGKHSGEKLVYRIGEI